MSKLVTIPTAQHMYFGEIRFRSDNVTQVTKLLRFSCTALDLGCENYKMWDYKGKGLTNREKYLDWVARWKKNYKELSYIIRFRKKMMKRDECLSFETQIRYLNKEETKDFSSEQLYQWYYTNNVSDLAHLQKCAQHMLNARYLYKLAGAEMRRREIEARDEEIRTEIRNGIDALIVASLSADYIEPGTGKVISGGGVHLDSIYPDEANGYFEIDDKPLIQKVSTYEG